MTKTQASVLCDGYKTSHRIQFPEGTEFIHSNLTARSAKYATVPDWAHDGKVVLYGVSFLIQKYFIEYFNNNFFNLDEDKAVSYFSKQMANYLGPDNNVGEEHVRRLHRHQRLPIRIKSLPEGTRVPIQVPMLIIENIGDEFFWVTNYLETILSTTLWMPITSATTSYGYRKLIEQYAEQTGGAKAFAPIQGHDFSFRGMAGLEAAMMSGSAHLTSFVGTDTIPAISFLQEYYGAEESEVVGISVPASEHATMCMGTKEDEVDTFKRFINKLYPNGIISIVSDTWDYWKVITEYLPAIKDDVMARDGKVVIRPDSGDPVRIVCGYTWDGNDYKDRDEAAALGRPVMGSVVVDYDAVKIDGKFYTFTYLDNTPVGGEFEIFPEKELMECEVKGSVQCLWETFGGEVNDQGFKTLDSHIGLIYGDSINFVNCEQILEGLMRKGFSSDNIVFGFGSYGYQMVTRDTFGMAVKATFGIVDGQPREIFKDPKTGSGKKSAKGLLSVIMGEDGELKLRQEVPPEEYFSDEGPEGCLFETVFENGEHLIKPTLKEIRNRLWDGFGDFSLG